MADSKISALPAVTSQNLADIVPIVDSSTTSQITLANFGASPTGAITPFAGRAAPSSWLFCYGQAVSQSTYASLYIVLNPTLGNVTITNASPAVVTLTAHGLQTGDPIWFGTSGTMPTGLSAITIYFAIYVSSSTFKVATTLANAYAGTAINTSSAQIGTVYVVACPWQVAAGYSATNFSVPDLRGNVLAGADAMGGTAAGRLNNTSYGLQGAYGNVGAMGGEQAHTQVTNELVSHSHTVHGGTVAGGSNVADFVVEATGNAPGLGPTDSTGGGSATNNVQPTAVVNYIIKT